MKSAPAGDVNSVGLYLNFRRNQVYCCLLYCGAEVILLEVVSPVGQNSQYMTCYRESYALLFITVNCYCFECCTSRGMVQVGLFWKRRRRNAFANNYTTIQLYFVYLFCIVGSSDRKFNHSFFILYKSNTYVFLLGNLQSQNTLAILSLNHN